MVLLQFPSSTQITIVLISFSQRDMTRVQLWSEHVSPIFYRSWFIVYIVVHDDNVFMPKALTEWRLGHYNYSRNIYYILELCNSRTKISVAPTSWRASILSDTSFFRIRDDTALLLPDSRFVTVGDFFPGVILIASCNSSFEMLYIIITYFVAVMYPSIRFWSLLIRSLCSELGFAIKAACVLKISWTTSNPAAWKKYLY